MRISDPEDGFLEHIKNDESRFARLREEHPDWYVANCGASWKLHRARCTRQKPTNGILWTSYEKVCGPNRITVETDVLQRLQHSLTECAFCFGKELR